MNKARRKQISDLSNEVAAVIAVIEDAEAAIEWPVVASTIEDLHSMSESIKDDEAEYLENMPEGLKGGEKGENAQTAIDAMEEASQKLEGAKSAAEDEAPDAEDVISHLNDAIEHLGEAEC